MNDDWQFAIEADKIEDEDVMPVEIAGQEIAIYRYQDKFYATSDKCTHGDAYLSEGVVVGEVIECPLHQGRFCMKTGKALSAPAVRAIATYPVKIEGGKVFIKLGAGSPK